MDENRIIRNNISNVFVKSRTSLEQNVVINTSFFTQAGDTFTLDRRSLRLYETESLGELTTVSNLDETAESNDYPYKNRIRRTVDSASLVFIRSNGELGSFPTSSQYYYTPIVYERYDPNILRNIDKTFYELEVTVVPSEAPGE